MQGERSSANSYPRMEQESISNSTNMNQETSWSNLVNPLESRLSNYILSSSESGFSWGSAVDRDVQGFSGWNLGEPSSSLNRQNQIIDDGTKMEHGWTSSHSAFTGAALRLDERRLEPVDVVPHENVNVGRRGSQITEGPLSFPSSSSSRIHSSVNAQYCGNGLQGGGQPSLYKSGRLETEQIPLAIGGAIGGAGTSSGNSGQLLEENDGGSSSSTSWGPSCKRKAFEGTSRQACLGGTSNCFPQSDSSIWHTVPARLNASGTLNMAMPPTNTPIGSPEHLNPGFGVVTRAFASDALPSSRAIENANSDLRHISRRAAVVRQRDSFYNGRRSNASSSHHPSLSFAENDPLDLRSTAGIANTSAPHIPGYSRTMLPLPWNVPSSSRAGSSSNGLSLYGESSATLRDEPNLRSVPRTNAEHPLFFPALETRNMAQDLTGWNFGPRNLGNPGVASSTSQSVTGSGVNSSRASGWMVNHNPPAQTQQRLSEVSPWTFFPSADSESGGQSSHFQSFSSGPSASSQEMTMPSGSNNQGRNQLFLRSSSLAERQGDDVFRVLAADIEGRNRFISEIRQVLSAMRRGEHLRAEDYMLFDPFIYHGMGDLHDRHRDMRLDVDNMTYEELLALEERIGDVKTGLSEETILNLMKQSKFTTAYSSDMEPCCICQEEYTAGDDLGTLSCGHDFHTDCVKQWLMQKNLCPICKTTALII